MCRLPNCAKSSPPQARAEHCPLDTPHSTSSSKSAHGLFGLPNMHWKACVTLVGVPDGAPGPYRDYRSSTVNCCECQNLQATLSYGQILSISTLPKFISTSTFKSAVRVQRDALANVELKKRRVYEQPIC
jgi:hypothetical protein